MATVLHIVPYVWRSALVATVVASFWSYISRLPTKFSLFPSIFHYPAPCSSKRSHFREFAMRSSATFNSHPWNYESLIKYMVLFLSNKYIERCLSNRLETGNHCGWLWRNKVQWSYQHVNRTKGWWQWSNSYDWQRIDKFGYSATLLSTAAIFSSVCTFLRRVEVTPFSREYLVWNLSTIWRIAYSNSRSNLYNLVVLFKR